MAAPWRLGSRKRLGPADIAKLPLLQSSTRPYAWREWFASLGLSVERDLAGPRMELFSMLTEAAAQGLGAALVPHFLVDDELAGGRLVVLNEHEFISKLAYYLIIPEHKVEDPLLALFGDWIATEAASYIEA